MFRDGKYVWLMAFLVLSPWLLSSCATIGAVIDKKRIANLEREPLPLDEVPTYAKTESRTTSVVLKTESPVLSGFFYIPRKHLLIVEGSANELHRVEERKRAAVDVGTDFTDFRDAYIASLDTETRQQMLALLRSQREGILPCDLVTTVEFTDRDSLLPNNTLDAGERRDRLKITTQNKGNGLGIGVRLVLSCDNDAVLFEPIHLLGDIDRNAERSVTVLLSTNIGANNGYATFTIETKERRGFDAQKQQIRIPVARLDSPKLAIAAVEVNDKMLGNAVGNGNSIPENGETVELMVFVHNAGVGNALGTKLELLAINDGFDVQVNSADLGTIRPNETVRGTLRFHIPRTFVAEALTYKVRVIDVRGADSAEKADAIPMSAQRPILVYQISPPKTITNGSTVDFTITPRNAGKLRAQSVRLQLSATSATVRPSSMDLGNIEAERSFKPRPFAVTLPRTFDDSELFLKIEFSQTDFDGLSQTESYAVRHIEPRLEIDDRLVIDANGDGQIQKGEGVEIEFTISNHGQLAALNTRLRVSVKDNRIQIDNAERALGRLEPNYASNPERFAFTIPRAVPAGELPITVEVAQADFPTVRRTVNYMIYEREVTTTTVTPTPSEQERQAPVPTANKPPVIVLSDNTPDTQTVYSANFTLRVSVSDDRGLDSANVKLNNAIVYDSQTDLDATRQLQASNRQLLSFDVPLRLREGENVVTITARDNDNQQASKSIRLTYERKAVVFELDNPSDVDVEIPQNAVKNTDAVALVIGIGDYRDITAATFADRDALTFREYLKRTFGYSEDRIILLINDHATRSDISRGLRRIENLLKPNHRSDVVVFYAGHGTLKIEGNRAEQYLVPYEADPNYPEDGYSLPEFYRRLSRMEAQSVTVFVDACFSGTDREAQAIVKGARSLLIPRLEIPKSLVPVLASSTSDQISSSYEPKRHGLFTYYLLKGIHGEADLDGNGEIILSELETYTQRQVSAQARQLWGRQY